MYVTDTPVIDRLINPEPMEELQRTHEDMRDWVLNSELAWDHEHVVLQTLDLFTDELATRLAAIA